MSTVYGKGYIGANIGTCEHCGRLFRQNKTNRIQYCYKHRGYQKKVLRFGVCVDCGREFSVAANNQSKVRCDDCQLIQNREKTRIRNIKYRQKKLCDDML